MGQRNRNKQANQEQTANKNGKLQVQALVGNLLGKNKCVIDDAFEFVEFDSDLHQQLFSLWHDALRTSAITSPQNNQHHHQATQSNQATLNSVASVSTHQFNSLTTNNHVTQQSTSNARSSTSRSRADRNANIHSTLQTKSGVAPGMSIFVNNIQIKKHKFNKAYSRYRTRSSRVQDMMKKQIALKLSQALPSTMLNNWKAYVALQAFREPQPFTQAPDSINNSGKKKSSKKNKQQDLQATKNADANKFKYINVPISTQPLPPTHQFQSTANSTSISSLPALNNSVRQPIEFTHVIRYSDKINPSQVAEYRLKAKIPTSVSFSKKSSSASYDVYEIMDVLANSDKTCITIARTTKTQPTTETPDKSYNAYTHISNPQNDLGIVSTQLHLQVRSSFSALATFYQEERKLIEEEQVRLDSVSVGV